MRLQRLLYFTQRTMADATAARRGRLGERLVRRELRRRVTGPAGDRIIRALLK